MMRRAVMLVPALMVLGHLLAPADEPSRPPSEVGPPRSAAEARPEWDSPKAREREETSLAFVREHHPELATLLAQLKAKKPKEYDRAIAELSQVSRSLAGLKQRDPRRYELGVEAWKAKSRTELLAARWVGGPSPELESQIRAALRDQYDVELRQQELEKELLEARLKKIDATIGRLKGDRDKLLQSRFRGLRNKVQRSRRPDTGKSAPAKPATAAKGDRTS